MTPNREYNGVSSAPAELESLRAQLKEAQKELENERARSIHSCGPNCQRPTCVNRRLTGQLAASQAREVQLREALEQLALIANKYAGHYPYQVATIIDKYISLTSDTTALEAMIAKAGEVMRERCANGCEKEAVQIVIDGLEERAYNCAVADCAAAIRALPGVTMEDLK